MEVLVIWLVQFKLKMFRNMRIQAGFSFSFLFQLLQASHSFNFSFPLSFPFSFVFLVNPSLEESKLSRNTPIRFGLFIVVLTADTPGLPHQLNHQQAAEALKMALPAR